MASKQAGPRPVATFDHLKKKKPAEIIKYIPLSEDAEKAHEEATGELQRARLIGDPEQVQVAQVALAQAEAELRDPENSIRLVFRSIGRDRFQDLLADYPPSQSDVDKAKEAGEATPDFDAEALAPNLISATLAEPALTPEQVRSLTLPEEEGGLGWNAGEFEVLFNTSIIVNRASRISDYSF